MHPTLFGFKEVKTQKIYETPKTTKKTEKQMEPKTKTLNKNIEKKENPEKHSNKSQKTRLPQINPTSERR